MRGGEGEVRCAAPEQDRTDGRQGRMEKMQGEQIQGTPQPVAEDFRMKVMIAWRFPRHKVCAILMWVDVKVLANMKPELWEFVRIR
jgi:hypothetical protein